MKCAISGSFRKYYKEICQAHDIFEQNGIVVLSPQKSRIINPGEEFALLETDLKSLSRKQLEDRHLEAIANSDFVYLVNPNGYIGNSATFEIGYAHGCNKPIYSLDIIEDITLQEYVCKIFSPKEIIDFLKLPAGR